MIPHPDSSDPAERPEPGPSGISVGGTRTTGIVVILAVLVVCLDHGLLSPGELVVAVVLDLLRGLLPIRSTVSATTDRGRPPGKDAPEDMS